MPFVSATDDGSLVQRLPARWAPTEPGGGFPGEEHVLGWSNLSFANLGWPCASVRRAEWGSAPGAVGAEGDRQ
jgi:hypothetical protein